MSYYDGKLYTKEQMKKEIIKKKLKIKEICEEYYKQLDSFDCGKTLAEYISPKLTQYRKEFNEIRNFLREFDSECPKDLEL